ncbi:DUF4293 domain-containing protein [Solitalea koreensis]|uniref:DUF4293 family protein n=1 Tax=Solitalea koreensis TaxID=543615 RepID=A0A521DHU5_9SPHI|nr:DUF4293 domain-containing protein [Solitalea koreensis]SMO71216.1 protein of unknown function [Solitalea koreensis]
MIQRVQSIYLALALIAAILLFFFPIVSFVHLNQVANDSIKELIEIRATGKYAETIEGFKQIQTYLANLIALGGIMVGLVAAIFSYKNRKQQTLICWAVILLTIVLSVLTMLKVQPENTPAVSNWTVKTGAYLLSVILILTLFARKAIAKDEALIKSVDRLR